MVNAMVGGVKVGGGLTIGNPLRQNGAGRDRR